MRCNHDSRLQSDTIILQGKTCTCLSTFQTFSALNAKSKRRQELTPAIVKFVDSEVVHVVAFQPPPLDGGARFLYVPPHNPRPKLFVGQQVLYMIYRRS